MDKDNKNSKTIDFNSIDREKSPINILDIFLNKL